MIICFYIEVKDKAEQVKVEQAMAAPFIDAGQVSELDLEAFDKVRRITPVADQWAHSDKSEEGKEP